MRKLFLASYQTTVESKMTNESEIISKYRLVAVHVNDDWTEEQEHKWVSIVFKDWCKLKNYPEPLSITIEETATESVPPKEESKRVNPLLNPSNFSLQEIFAELKFGRPAASQKYLQELIDELNEPEPNEVDRNLSVYVERNLLHSLFSKFADKFSDDLAIDLNTIEKIESRWSKFVESLDIDQIEEDRKSAKSIWCHNIIMGEGLTKDDIAMRGKNLSEFEKTHGYKFE